MFDAPRHGRGFFEALIVDNLDLGRPHNVEIIFGRKVRRDTRGTFRTAIDRRDNGGVLLNVFYKHSRIKQYLKDGRALRIETVVNTPRDLGCHARLPKLDDLQAKARADNNRYTLTPDGIRIAIFYTKVYNRLLVPLTSADQFQAPPDLRAALVTITRNVDDCDHARLPRAA